ncbi:MAG: hypothetical protein ABIR52_09805 [Casimicrobiaceae bacterium]
MKRRHDRSTPARQRGWAGLILLVIALVIVGMLAKTVLQSYGLTGTATPASRTTPVGQASHEVTTVVPAPRDAMERARGLEQSVQQQAQDLNKRIDEASKVK